MVMITSDDFRKLVRRPVWTRTPPTEPGQYWIRHATYDPRVVTVYRNGLERGGGMMIGDQSYLNKEGMEFAGPLPDALEPEITIQITRTP